MESLLSDNSQENINRGLILVVCSALTVLLKFIIPVIAPYTVGFYGIYRLGTRNFQEGGIAILIALLLWLLRAPFGWLLWVVAAIMAGFGLFLLIAGLRDRLSN